MSSATILLVDDEPNVTDALKRALRREPCTFFTATSAEAALAILAAEPVDVVISDEQMPGMSGSMFLGLVRTRYPDTIRMILSGQASLEAAVRAINEGEVYRFLVKPCNPMDLILTVRQALVHKRLEIQSRRLLREYQLKAAQLARVEFHSPGLLHLDTDEQGALVVDDCDAEINALDLLAAIEAAMTRE